VGKSIKKKGLRFFHHPRSTQAESILTFEGEKLQGQAAILAKLTGLPFQVRSF
jgi:hypothetical protein